MIAVDTNVLVHAHREELPLHAPALAWLTRLAEGPEPWALPVFVLGEFLRVVTHPRIFDPPTTLEDALEALTGLLESPSIRVLRPGDRFPQLLEDTCRRGAATGNIVFDAQIAAALREHGVREILTEDRDFTRFSWLTVVGVGGG